MDTTAKKATGIPASFDVSAGRVMMSANRQTPRIAATGTWLWFSRVQNRQPGTARSRENA